MTKPPPPRTVVLATLAVAAAATLFLGCGASDIEPIDTVSADPGAAIYASSCASCHGSTLQGTDKGPSQLSIVYEPNHHTDDSYRSAIANGARQHHWSFGDMAPVEGLTDDEVEAVIAFIRSEQQRLGFQR